MINANQKQQFINKLQVMGLCRICALILFCFAVFNAYSQDIPAPTRYYPLNYQVTVETMHHRDAVIAPGSRVATERDRFGQEGGALRFAPFSYLITPNFFMDAPYENGFTITFWMLIDRDFEKQTTVIPWTTKDQHFQAFYAENNGQAMLGFGHKGDRAIIDRYVKDKNGKIKNYPLWLWDPVNLTQRRGWYMVAMSVAKNHTRTYLFYPDGQMAYALHYLGLQDLEKVTQWGIGSRNNTLSQVIDDFKVYAQTLSKDEIRTLYSREAPPSGMYEISPKDIRGLVCSTQWKQDRVGVPLMCDFKSEGNEPTGQWVIEPKSGEKDMYNIRMAYHPNTYLWSNSQKGGNIETENQKWGTDWIITHAGDGYFHIKCRSNPNLMWRMVIIDGNAYVKLDFYDPSLADYYLWSFNVIKTQHELNDPGFKLDTAYAIVDNYNSINSLVPKLPFSLDETPMLANRDTYVSLLGQYKFRLGIDGSVAIFSDVFWNKAVCVKDARFFDNQPVIMKSYHSQEDIAFRFLLKKPNPLGRRVQIVPVMQQTKSLFNGYVPAEAPIVINDNKVGEPDSHLWQLFETGGSSTPVKEVYSLPPGIYRISTKQNGNRPICPYNHGWTEGTDLVLRDYDEEYSTSFLWFVDYERTEFGEAVRDGSYMFQLLGTDKLFMGNDDPRFYEDYPVKLTRKTLRPGASKWFLVPTKDGTGSFYIQSGIDRRLHLHCQDDKMMTGTKVNIEFLPEHGDQHCFRWYFERVDVPAPIQPGVYRIRPVDDPSLAVHSSNDKAQENEILEIAPPTKTGTFEWQLLLNRDHTYHIRLADHSLYMHTNDNSLEKSANVMVNMYNPKFSHTYKWLITKSEDENQFYVTLVGHPGWGDLHLFRNNVHPGTKLEVYSRRIVPQGTARWMFQRVNPNENPEPSPDPEPEPNPGPCPEPGVGGPSSATGRMSLLDTEPNILVVTESDLIEVSCPEDGIVGVRLFDMMGRTISNSSFDGNDHLVIIPGHQGLFIIEVILNSGRRHREKIFVK